MRTVAFFLQDLIQIVRKVASKEKKKNNPGVIGDISGVNTATAFNCSIGGVLDDTVVYSEGQ